MKYLLCAFFVLFMISCKSDKSQPTSVNEITTPASDNLNWIKGNWERVGEKEGNRTYEYWKQNSAGEYIGMGCTLKGVDTVWKEDVLLAKDADGWKFEVVGLGDTVSTIFRVTQMTKTGFVCENDANEFPKKIEYAFDGKSINAVISGGGPTIPFNFVRMKQ